MSRKITGKPAEAVVEKGAEMETETEMKRKMRKGKYKN